MDATADDNFFIDEPQKLRNNFFNKDKSQQMVELLAHKQHDTNKRMQLNRIQTCRLFYNKKLQQLQHQQHQPHHQQQATMPRSFITRLEFLCQAALNTDDVSLAKRAVDTLVSASKSGCCFLERYIVMLMNFCLKKYPLSDTMKIKVDELLDGVLIVDFDRQQLTENLRRPEYKITSIDQIVQLLRKVRDMLYYREHKAVDWLHVILDAYFVELATTDEAVGIIDQINDHINFQCALLREIDSSKCLLNSILEQLHCTVESDATNSTRNRGHRRHYSIEQIEI